MRRKSPNVPAGRVPRRQVSESDFGESLPRCGLRSSFPLLYLPKSLLEECLPLAGAAQTEDQEKFAAYAWMLAQRRTALAKQLAEVESYEREAIRVAEHYGVKQKTLSTLTGRSPGRISQIVSEDSTSTDNSLLETVESWRVALDEPQDHLARLSKKFTTAETIETWNAHFNLIFNKDSDVF